MINIHFHGLEGVVNNLCSLFSYPFSPFKKFLLLVIILHESARAANTAHDTLLDLVLRSVAATMRSSHRGP